MQFTRDTQKYENVKSLESKFLQLQIQLPQKLLQHYKKNYDRSTILQVKNRTKNNEHKNKPVKSKFTAKSYIIT